MPTRRTKRGLDRVEKLAREWPSVTFVAATNTQRVVAPKMLHDLAQPAPKVRYPIAWQSERQRRAFFASNGFGHGIPYRRTGGATRDWRAHLNRTRGAIVSRVTNQNHYLIFVRYTRPGTRSRIQRMHLNTGHQNANLIINRHRREWRRIFKINLATERRRRR